MVTPFTEMGNSGKKASFGGGNQESCLTRLNLSCTRGEVIIELGIGFLNLEKFELEIQIWHHQHIHGHEIR